MNEPLEAFDNAEEKHLYIKECEANIETLKLIDCKICEENYKPKKNLCLYPIYECFMPN
ncbi:hypothetical protein HCQ94_03790 [Actinomyces sp. zg-332]|uniref:hypothetical protein n=1 Tax=Actinomyces sp. zg-332 TaxID=2708340 RepID=UPI00142372A0|nr:hypothetical protein [Actinomyces sp. zg-332]QPK93725.1 hypothetical protein HCQ94_03790 [Actinomyces sp. zg-332]